MKLKLSVSKRHVDRVSGTIDEVVFAVVDLDKAKSYPSNFVCLLPKNLERGIKPSNRFLGIYGNESNQIATKLLTNALRSESDLAVISEIEKRLKALAPKPDIENRCRLCGVSFQPKFGRHQQRICQKCRTKIQTAQ
ncbi:MAG: hypothetical protein LAN71_16720 [Acidobacteriia bacterium]|nr:hypothetical protein [Terriglobia bacterium]